MKKKDDEPLMSFDNCRGLNMKNININTTSSREALKVTNSDNVSATDIYATEFTAGNDVSEIIETLKEYHEISASKIEELRLILVAKDTVDAKREKTNKWLQSIGNTVFSESVKATFDYLKNKFGL